MEFNLTVTDQEVNLIGAGLQELPFKVAAPLIQKLQQQVSTQQTTETSPPTASASEAQILEGEVV